MKKVNKLKNTFAIEASIEKVLSMKVDQTWLLEVQVKDIWSKNEINVKLHDEIVANFAGHTAKEMNAMQEKMKTQPQLRGDLTAIIERINDEIQKESFLMALKLKVVPPNKYENWVMKILNKTDDNKRVIMLKIHDERLD